MRVDSGMARPTRLFAPELPAHVTVRGNDRQAIFRSKDDRAFFRVCLREACRRHEVAIHCYVMMTNHIHLLLSATTAKSLPRALQSVGRRYVGYFNDQYARTGTLWEGRYHASLVQADSHFVMCHRYIDLNPVRGGLVAQPQEFEWSSHRHYALGCPDDLVTPHSVIADLGATLEKRRAAYRSLFDRPMSAEAILRIRQALQLQRPLGDERFVAGFTRGVCMAPAGTDRDSSHAAADSDS
jgi:putative transposase